MDRRGFLLASAAAAALPGWAGAQNQRLGLQLYTVRDALRQDFQGTLNAVSRIGYREVELAGLGRATPQAMRAALQRHGLAVPSMHASHERLRRDLEGMRAGT